MRDNRDSSGTSARARLRSVHERQVAALAAFGTLEGRAARLRQQLADVEAEQRGALADLARVAGADLAAELTGAGAAKVRDALGGRRHVTGSDTAAAELSH